MIFEVLMVDPPWPTGRGGKRRHHSPTYSRAMDYPQMPIEAIYALLDEQIFPLSVDNCTVFLWTVDRCLHPAELAMESRGFKLHARLIWDKGNGVAPALTVRYSHEYLLWYYKSPFQPIDKSTRGKFRTILQEKPREHSRKPEVAYRLVEALYPNACKWDVFCREKRTGWYQFGNEVNKFRSATC